MIVAVTNQKGGVGKTTSVLNIGAELAKAGKKTLVIDLDPQGSLSVCFGIRELQNRKNMYHVLCMGVPIGKIVIPVRENLDLAPADILLSAADIEMSAKLGRETTLSRVLDKIKGQYDYVLIDCQPSLSLLPVNALCAADAVIVPVTPEFLSYMGLELLFDTLGQIKEAIGKEIAMLGLVVTMYDGRTKHAQEALTALERRWDILGTVSRTVAVQDAILAASPIGDYAAQNKATSEYMNITQNIIAKTEGK